MKGRSSSKAGLHKDDGELELRLHAEVVDFTRYIPSVLSRVVTRFRLSANDFFGRRYGLTLLEWRIVSFLAGEGQASAYTIWTRGSLDRAAVSRALRALERRGLLSVAMDGDGGGRRRYAVALTNQGHDLHTATLHEVIVRHARLIAGISRDDLDTFLRVLHRIERQIPDMARDDAAPTTYDMTRRV